jgi:predicted peptidase
MTQKTWIFLLLFLYGAGERGNENEKSWRSEPAFLPNHQTASGIPQWWSFRSARKKAGGPGVRWKRIPSGMGTFDLVDLRPETFAAAFPICGGGDPRTARNISSITSFWIFHGTEDKVVDPAYSVEMAAALQRQKGKEKLTLYPGVSHNSGENALAEPDLLPWIFSNSR